MLLTKMTCQLCHISNSFMSVMTSKKLKMKKKLKGPKMKKIKFTRTKNNKKIIICKDQKKELVCVYKYVT